MIKRYSQGDIISLTLDYVTTNGLGICHDSNGVIFYVENVKDSDELDTPVRIEIVSVLEECVRAKRRFRVAGKKKDDVIDQSDKSKPYKMDDDDDDDDDGFYLESYEEGD